MSNTSVAEKPVFELKGSLFTLTVIRLFDTDLGLFSSQLTKTIAKAPKFFHYAPIVIDLSHIQSQETVIDFSLLCSILRESLMIPVGVSGGNETLYTAAKAAGLSVFADTKSNLPQKPIKKTPIKVENTLSNTLFINRPIRSGQQIYARDHDLIILGSVSPGAEILADGNIHVYGAMRGRALAGVKGNREARIFCHQLEAELISIAGFYRLHDDERPLIANNTHIYLENESIILESF